MHADHDAKRSGLKNVSWRTTPSLWRRSAPPGSIRPCEPTLVDRPPAGPDWLHEIKHDGFRILAWKQGERVRVWTRRAADFTDRFSRIAEAIRSLTAWSFSWSASLSPRSKPVSGHRAISVEDRSRRIAGTLPLRTVGV
jgi:hypothetical protein